MNPMRPQLRRKGEKKKRKMFKSTKLRTHNSALYGKDRKKKGHREDMGLGDQCGAHTIIASVLLRWVCMRHVWIYLLNKAHCHSGL